MSATMTEVHPNRFATASSPRVRRPDTGFRKPVHSTRDDAKHVRLSCEVLGDRFEAMLEAWYRFLGSNPLVLYYFTQKSYDRPDPPAVRKAFARWIVDSENVESEPKEWDESHDTSLGHHSLATDRAESDDAVQSIILRYVLALLYPVTAKQKLHQAWVKSVLQETFASAASTARECRSDSER